MCIVVRVSFVLEQSHNIVLSLLRDQIAQSKMNFSARMKAWNMASDQVRGNQMTLYYVEGPTPSTEKVTVILHQACR